MAYKVTVTLEDAESFQLEFKSRKVAVDVREQLKKAGYVVKAEMTKELD